MSSLTKEDLEKKVESLKKQREDTIATLNALSGAIQFAEQLIKETSVSE